MPDVRPPKPSAQPSARECARSRDGGASSRMAARFDMACKSPPSAEPSSAAETPAGPALRPMQQGIAAVRGVKGRQDVLTSDASMDNGDGGAQGDWTERLCALACTAARTASGRWRWSLQLSDAPGTRSFVTLEGDSARLSVLLSTSSSAVYQRWNAEKDRLSAALARSCPMPFQVHLGWEEADWADTSSSAFGAWN